MQSGRPKEFLLDTGVFYALSRAHVQAILANKQHMSLSASVVVPFELLSGIPKSDDPSAAVEFQRRKAALSKYECLVGTSGTYWDEPFKVRARAFGVTSSGSGQPPLSFQILVKACTDCDSVTELDGIIKAAKSLSNSMPSLDWLRREADTVSEGFRRSFGVGSQLVRAVTQSQLPQDEELSDKTQRKLVRGFVPFLHDAGDLKMYVFLILAAEAGIWHRKLPDCNLYEACVKTAKMLKPRYDGSVDLYVDAFASYFKEKWLDGGTPQRNDPFDLDHIVYLRKNEANQFLVTTDNGLIMRCLQVAPGRAIGIGEFLAQIPS